MSYPNFAKFPTTCLLCLFFLARGSLSCPRTCRERATGLAGQQTAHNVQADWVLKREYLSIHEVSQEKDAKGDPAYEAIVFVSWDPKTQEYACLWLDSTGGGACPCRESRTERDREIQFLSCSRCRRPTQFATPSFMTVEQIRGSG